MAEQKNVEQKSSDNKIADGWYSFKNMNSNMMLDVKSGSFKSGAKILQQPANGTGAQSFYIRSLDNGYYSIQNERSLLFFNFEKDNKDALQQTAGNGSDAQQFQFVECGKNTYYIKAKISGKCLDVKSASTKKGANIWQYTPNQTDSQKFVITLNATMSKIPTGYYLFKNVNSKMMLDVKDGSKVGAAIKQYSANLTDAQLFYVKEANDGYYSIQNKESKLFFEIAGGSFFDDGSGGKLQQNAGNGNYAQQFAFTECDKNTYYIRVRQSGMVLDVPAASTEEGQNIQQHTWNKTDAQKFVIIPGNYKLKARIFEFDYGDQKELEQTLENSKKIAFNDKKKITVKELGLKVKGAYGEAVKESFSFSFKQTIGVGVEAEYECSIPLLGGSKTKVSAKFEFSANQKSTTTKTNDFTTGYEYEPAKTGIYEVGMIVHVASDVKIPFNATVEITATGDDGKEEFSGQQIDDILKFTEFDCQIESINDKTVKAKISGAIQAKFAVSSDIWNNRIGDI